MSSALPLALRARFREYIEEGLSGRAAAARLKLSAATGVRWQRKLLETGSVEPERQGRPPGHGKLSSHQALLEELVAQDGDITLPELAGALASASGVMVHAASIGRFLRKLGYTYKKSRWLPPNDCALGGNSAAEAGSSTIFLPCKHTLIVWSSLMRLL